MSLRKSGSQLCGDVKIGCLIWRPAVCRRLMPYLLGTLLLTGYFLLEAAANIPYLQGKGEQVWYAPFFLFPLRLILPAMLWYGSVSALNLWFGVPHSKVENFVRGICWAAVVFVSFQPNSAQPAAPYESFMRGFREKANAAFTAAELRGWRERLIETSRVRDGLWEVPEREIPVELLNLYGSEPGITIDFQDSRDPILVIRYGGGFRAWGLIVRGTQTEPQHHVHLYPWEYGIFGFYERN